MQDEIYIIVDSTGWISPFYFSSFKAAYNRLGKLCSLRCRTCKIEKLEKSFFDEY